MRRIKKASNNKRLKALTKCLTQLHKAYNLIESQQMECYIETARAEIHAAYLNVWHQIDLLDNKSALKRRLELPTGAAKFVFQDNMPPRVNLDMRLAPSYSLDLDTITIYSEEVTPMK